MKRILWNNEEVAILIDYYIKNRDKFISREDAVKRASQELRNKALNAGLAIDETYRNENGISLQLIKIEDLFEGKEFRMRPPSALFEEMVTMYNENYAKFVKILEKARKKI